MLREGRFNRLNVRQVQEALAAALLDEPSEAVKKSLLKLYPQHENRCKTPSTLA